MKKTLSKVIAIVVGGFTMLSPILNHIAAYAYEGAIIKTDNDGADGIKEVLKIVVNVMTVGIGVLGVIGITIAGIQYLTAGGNEEKTRKAKRRIFEIIIGLAAYAVIYALLNWLLPGFNGINFE